MRLSLCLYAILFASCGSVRLKEMDSGVVSRGETGQIDPGTGGVSSTGGTVGTGGMPGVGGSTGMGGTMSITPDASIDTTMIADVNNDAQSTHNCDLCKLNCVSPPMDAGVQAQIDYCNGCISNCPVNGLKLLCRCDNGCGYDPVQGTCRE